MIKSIAIEALSTERLERVYIRFGDKFLNRFFSDDEIAYLLNKRVMFPTLAGRLALKIAFCKALGEIIALKEIKIKNDEKGKPFITCRKLEGLVCEASISHEKDLAVATVVLGK